MPKLRSRRKTETPVAQPAVIALPNLDKQSTATLTPLNFRVPPAFHREFKLYAGQHGMSMVDLLKKAFLLFKAQRG